MPYLTSAFATNGRRFLWLGLMVAASMAFTFGFACAVPFAAFGAIAALTLPRREALLLTVALWLVNQVIGFTVLSYPWDGMTFLWGAILGVVAVLSTVAALAVITQRSLVVSAPSSFGAAFIVYEGVLYLVSIPMGATADFTAAIVVRILEINVAGFAALLAAALLAASASARFGSLGRPQTPILSR
jgi:hypothetical protein